MGTRGDARVRHPVFARFWARQASSLEDHGAAGHRQRLLAGVVGRVVEVGAGTGANFRHYPSAVTEAVAVEPEGHLRDLARRAASAAPVPVTVVDGTADRLPADDGAFDAAVVSLVLCTVPDQATALREVHRVLRPGGRLHFWEHVRADRPGLARVQRLLDASVWPAFGGGCHTARDTAAAIAAAGFTVDRLERFAFPETQVPLPANPQILGTAVRS
ncbi:SAM-dependent methyltransferase [Geodermatophilus sp. TF02-6]|uniref:class I SAM-dependent methyltransferase n=1 Tax=Geodermatophilus sp. TF02-6 TaxID=2250575 RepID=UPI000DEB6793|nr:class I SAM-dependent methyltransferase [Geodermatophilus sp. TF02-6]RBY75817.1 SAM-dependent methyltransferase [Geodermatophilus sp. TF02-6]